MNMLPLSTRLATGLVTLIRPANRRRTVDQLNALDDHLLKDIGLNRLDVRRMW